MARVPRVVCTALAAPYRIAKITQDRIAPSRRHYVEGQDTPAGGNSFLLLSPIPLEDTSALRVSCTGDQGDL
jgi:hypothetical protein